jgi:GT2 family glycosyltransferase
VAVHFPDEQGRPTHVNKVEFLLHDDPVEVGGVGFGFVAMKQGVFETMERPWFLINRVKWDDVDFYTNVGEDYSWCANAQRAGYKIWVDPHVKVLHHKETVYVV